MVKTAICSILEESGAIHLIIYPEYFAGFSNEQSGQMVLNEILKFLKMKTIENLNSLLVDEDYLVNFVSDLFLNPVEVPDEVVNELTTL